MFKNYADPDTNLVDVIWLFTLYHAFSFIKIGVDFRSLLDLDSVDFSSLMLDMFSSLHLS